MTHESHLWIPGAKPPPIRPHSLEKHWLLKLYLARYVETLTQNIRVERLRLTIIDGFAGGNIYTDSVTGELRSGSPSIIIETLREAERFANEKRRKPFKILADYFFIEKDPGAFGFLSRTLKDSAFSKELCETINPINGDFSSHYRNIIEFINRKGKSGRSIFILDQCGYSAVPFQAIREIFANIKNAEVILTFATDSLIDYLTENGPNLKLANNPELDLDALASELQKDHPLWRRLIQLRLHSRLQELTNAKFFTPFFIHSKDSHRDLWLVHLSRHYRARDVMVGVHWERQNSFAHFGKPGLKMLGYDPDEDILNTHQPWFPGFYFDGKAKALTKESLCEDLPKIIVDKYDRVDVKSLFSDISNEMPATSQILNEVLHQLETDGLITIKDKTGLISRKAGVQHESDVIYVPRQKWLPFSF